jgi:hypothetical protein
VSWLQVDQTFPGHRKTRQLGRRLGDEARAAGCLVNMWLWSIDSCGADGTLPAEDGWILEEAAKWTGAEGELVAALCEVGFLHHEEDRLRIHAWEEHEGRILEQRRQCLERQRRRRAKVGTRVTRDSRVSHVVEDRQTDRHDQEEKTEKTDTHAVGSVSSSIDLSGLSGLEPPADEAERAMLQELAAVGFPVTTPQHMLLELRALGKGFCYIHLEEEIHKWCEYVSANGAPRKPWAALEGWLKTAQDRQIQNGAGRAQPRAKQPRGGQITIIGDLPIF